ncbi:Uncharacterized protein QTN25_010306 [Entamoeba marina]
MSDKSFLIIPESSSDKPKIQELGMVMTGFTTAPQSSAVLDRARSFIPLFAEGNKHVKQGVCDPTITGLNECNTEEPHREGQKEECYVEMDIALGVLSEEGSDKEEE